MGSSTDMTTVVEPINAIIIIITVLLQLKEIPTMTLKGKYIYIFTNDYKICFFHILH